MRASLLIGVSILLGCSASDGGGGPGGRHDAGGGGGDSGGGGFDSGGGGTDSGGGGTDGGGGGDDAGGGGTDGGGGGGDVIFCDGSTPCPTGFECQMSLCTSTGIGFCARTPVDMCGGFRPEPDTCDDPEDVCLGQGMCVADAPGVCVTRAQRDQICERQRAFWACD